MKDSFTLYKNDAADRERSLARTITALRNLPLALAFKVTVEDLKPKRSDAQLRYLNGVCYKLIGDAIGYERDEVSEFLCGTFFGWREKKVPKKPSNPTGLESVPIRTTTTDESGARDVLNKQQFADFLAFVQRFAASKGIHIPDPDQTFGDSAEEQAA